MNSPFKQLESQKQKIKKLQIIPLSSCHEHIS